jgi:hypothetical protein
MMPCSYIEWKFANRKFAGEEDAAGKTGGYWAAGIEKIPIENPEVESHIRIPAAKPRKRQREPSRVSEEYY